MHTYFVTVSTTRPSTCHFSSTSTPCITTGGPSSVRSPSSSIISHIFRLFALATQLFVVCSIPLATALPGLRPVLRITSGSIATISSVAIIPTRTTAQGPPWFRIVAYLLWGLANCAYACLQWLDIPVRYQRLYLFSVILLAGHFTVALAQSINSISDAATIYGPFLLTTCEFLMALFYNPRHTNVQNEEGEAPILATVDTISIITTVIGV